MSDFSSIGPSEIAGLSVAIDADLNPLNAGMDKAVAKAKAGAEETGRSWSQAFSGMAMGANRAVSQMSMAMGGESFLTPIANALQAVQYGLQRTADGTKAPQQGFLNMASAGRGLFSVGLVIEGLAGALTKLSAPLQRANAALTTAIDNTNNSLTGAANSIKDYEAQIGSAAKTGAQFGFAGDQVRSALAKLTVQTKDPTEALKEMSFAETLAAATGQSLSTAADRIGRMHAGQFRYLRQFGIHIDNITNYQKAAEKAAKELATAQERLGASTQRLNDFEARMTAQREKAQAVWADRVQKADQTASDAHQHFADLQARLADQETTQRQGLAEAVEAADQRMQDASTRLADVEAQQAARAKEQQDARRESLEGATRSYKDAVNAQAQLMQRQAFAGGPRNAAEAVTRQQERENATRSVGQALERLNDEKGKAAQTDSQALSDATALRDAHKGVAQAADALTDAQSKQAKGEKDTLTQRQELVKAQEAMRRADENAAKVKAAAASAGEMTVAQTQEERRLKEEIVKWTEKQTKAQQDVNAAADGQRILNERFQQGMDEFMKREAGLLQRRERTWAGHVAKLRAEITNLFQSAGGAAPALTAIGGVGMGVGGLLQLGGLARRGVGGIAGRINRSERGAVGGAEGVSGIAGEGEAAVGVFTRLKGVLGTIGGAAKAGFGALKAAALGLLPTLIEFAVPIAIIGALAIAGYLIYKNWNVIGPMLKGLWSDIVGFATAVFSGVVNFFKKWGLDIILLLTPGGMIVEIVRHWDKISKVIMEFGPKIFKWATGLIGDSFTWLNGMGENLLKGLWNGIVGSWDWFTKQFEHLLKGSLVGKALGALGIMSPSTVFADMGKNVVLGFHQGIVGNVGILESASARMTGAVTGGAPQPGSSFVSSGRGGGATTVILHQEIHGSVIAERDLHQRTRALLRQEGFRNGGSVQYISGRGVGA